ncbi:helix-turn-helix domain-containing protein [Nonomuraea sp. NPDC046802]|uniref:TetR/AcrR family transcriptional regulator n=1 Tax=Nonomuraea sp. NPDC046802 TaxID=3154919 RepID=UPI0033D6C78A
MSKMRADAVRNRRLLLDAAAAELAEHGTEVSIARIAARAGIGKGTVFRHFATKEQLVAAIFSDRLDGLTAKGEALLNKLNGPTPPRNRLDGGAAPPDAYEGRRGPSGAPRGGGPVLEGAEAGEAGSGGALLEFMAAAVELQASDRAFCQALTADLRHEPQIRAASDRLVAVAESLTSRARQDGHVRGDVTGPDVVLLINAVSQATAPLGDALPGLWRRYLSMIFDGLRPEAARPLPEAAPTSLAPPGPTAASSTG